MAGLDTQKDRTARKQSTHRRFVLAYQTAANCVAQLLSSTKLH